MTWSSRFRAREYGRGSLWIVPTGNLSARYMRLWYRDRLLKATRSRCWSAR